MFKYPNLSESVSNINISTNIKNPGGDADNTIIDVSKFHLQMGKNPFDMILNIKTPVSDPDINSNIKGKLDMADVKNYYPLEEGEKLSEDYIEENKIIAQKQVVIGGQRLASQIKALKLDNWTGAKKQSLME